jgi:predicted metalloendopeptidase
LREVLINKFSQFPLITSNYSAERSVVQNLIRYKAYSSFDLFYVGILPDPKDPNSKKITLSQPDWFYPTQYYTENEQFVKAYKTLITTVVSYLNPSIGDRTDEIEDMYQLEKLFSLVIISLTQKLI